MGSDRTHLDIDLAAIAANYRWLRQAAPEAEMAAVVKADGYGLGAVAVTRALVDAGCRTFFVSRLEEGLDLRATFAEPEILVLDGLTGVDPAVLIDASLIPVLNHGGELASWVDAARAHDRRLAAALHVDTGMNRLGFGETELQAVDKTALRHLDLRCVMSHLACADTPDHAMNGRQRDRFRALSGLFPDTPKSLANSAGVMLGADYQFDLCRPGIALFGGNPVPAEVSPLEPVVRLMAPVLQIHEITRAGTVGYGATYAVQPGMRLATIGLGYADGLLRAASNVLNIELDGIALPVAGRISMDLVTLDITNLPAGRLQPGDWVPVIDGAGGVDRWAAAAGTIPYELLTRLGTRLKRRYIPAP